MNGRNWKIWQRGTADSKAASAFTRPEEGAPDECAQWTPFLTALFDGEADEPSAREARRHLLRCERCAQRWLGWNRMRAFLLDQTAPAPPASLLWRIRVACHLTGNPAPSDLHSQILARTSRQGAASARRGRIVWNTFASRASTPAWGLAALGVCVLLLGRDAYFASPTLVSQPTVAFDAPVSPRTSPVSRSSSDLPVLPTRSEVQARSSRRSSSPLRAVSASGQSNSAKTLLLVRRERVRLASISVAPQASPEVLAPLPEASPLPVTFVSWSGTSTRSTSGEPRSSGRNRLVRLTQAQTLNVRTSPARPLSSRSPVARPVVLASVPATTSETSMAPASDSVAPTSPRTGRIFLASAPLDRARLRISAPRVRPVTVGQDAGSDGPGLDDLNSTVEEYRSSLSDDSPEFVSDAG